MKRRNRSRTLTRRRLLAAGACGALALALLAPSPVSAQQEAGQNLHGATPMDQQMQQLQQLLPDGDVTAAPRGVDPAIWAASVPEDNAMTAERVELGRKLYFDLRLSADGTVSCATCHDVTRGFTDRRNVSEGIGGQLGRRNAPTTLNAALLTTQFWDGRAITLEDQAKLPILNSVEMGQPDEATALAAIADLPEYQEGFQKAYGREPNYADVGRAIAAFERTLMFLDAPVDRFLAGEREALSESARRGFDLFNNKARCATCHPINPAAPIGSDNRFHNIGVSARHQDFERLAAEALAALDEDASQEKLDELALDSDLSELGRFMVTKRYSDVGAFKTEQLRNVGITAPYMHDGSLQTLWDVMDHYNKGGEANPFLDGGIVPLALSEQEVDDVVAFLFALTDRRFAEQNRTEEQSQRARAAKHRPFRDEALAMRRALPFEARVMGPDASDGAGAAQEENR